MNNKLNRNKAKRYWGLKSKTKQNDDEHNLLLLGLPSSSLLSLLFTSNYAETSPPPVHLLCSPSKTCRSSSRRRAALPSPSSLRRKRRRPSSLSLSFCLPAQAFKRGSSRRVLLHHLHHRRRDLNSSRSRRLVRRVGMNERVRRRRDVTHDEVLKMRRDGGGTRVLGLVGVRVRKRMRRRDSSRGRLVGWVAVLGVGLSVVGLR